MGWPVTLTGQSQDDLREIVTFIARDSPSNARRFGNQLTDQALSSVAFPRSAVSFQRLAIRLCVRSSTAPTASFTN